MNIFNDKLSNKMRLMRMRAWRACLHTPEMGE